MPARTTKKAQARRRSARAVVSRLRRASHRSKGRAVVKRRPPARRSRVHKASEAYRRPAAERLGTRARGVLVGSKPSDECYAPRWLAALAREVLGAIDLDPASCAHANRVIRAQRWYGKRQDGLKRRWRGRVYLNKPFSQPAPWVRKLIASFDSRDVSAAFLVCNSRTGSRWFDLLSRRAWRCELLKRVQFWGPATKKKQTGRLDQVLFYLGPSPERFSALCAPHGRIYPPSVTPAVTPGARVCAVCPRLLQGRRSDSDTCSHACRQRKYRLREQAINDGVLVVDKAS